MNNQQNKIQYPTDMCIITTYRCPMRDTISDRYVHYYNLSLSDAL